MSEFKEYEKRVIQRLLKSRFDEKQIEAVLSNSTFASLEFTGCGYFLTVQHSVIPQQRIVCSEPNMIGTYDGDDYGFIVFLEAGELTLECYSYVDNEVQSDIRENEIVLAK